ncbi:transcriptional regulator [Candidatus Hodarchaeum mangrovi]
MKETNLLRENIPLNELDSTVHEPVRLGVLTLLHLNSSLTFGTIQKGLGVTSGNLNTHLTKLIQEEFIKQEKTFIDVRPRTIIHITPKGRNALINYTKCLKQILEQIQQD